MARYCPNCGTEVEDTAVFCPTCGQPIDQAAPSEIPPAPAWPDAGPPEGDADEAGGREPAEPAVEHAWHSRFDEPTRTEQAPTADDHGGVPPPVAPATSRTARPADRSAPPPQNVPVTMPLTLSAWLIGVGTIVAALGVLIGLFVGALNPIDLILLVALVAIAATVFFSSSVPAVQHLRLVTLVVVLIGFGMALDRIGIGGAGIGELLLFLGTAAAAIGAILLEMGHDQPLGGPRA